MLFHVLSINIYRATNGGRKVTVKSEKVSEARMMTFSIVNIYICHSVPIYDNQNIPCGDWVLNPVNPKKQFIYAKCQYSLFDKECRSVDPCLSVWMCSEIDDWMGFLLLLMMNYHRWHTINSPSIYSIASIMTVMLIFVMFTYDQRANKIESPNC